MKRHFWLAAAVLVALVTVPAAQMKVVPVDEQQGHVALGLALRHLANAGIYMMATAHPDDENNGLLVMLNRGQGYRTALATATRGGNGGQNEIGPELFEALGVLRTENWPRCIDSTAPNGLHASRRLRSPLTSTRRSEVGTRRDYRRLRPPDSHGSSRCHQRHAANGDGPGAARAPCRVRHSVARGVQGGRRPDEVPGTNQGRPSGVAAEEVLHRGGLRRRWRRQPGTASGADDAHRSRRVRSAARQDLLGNRHRGAQHAQVSGAGAVAALPGPSAGAFQLVESAIAGAMDRDERGLFDGIDTKHQRPDAVRRRAPAEDLVDGLAAVSTNVLLAQKKFDTEGDGATLQPLLAGLHAVRVLRGQLRTLPIDDAARYEIEFRLRQKEREFQQAAITCPASALKRSPTTASWCPVSR